MVYIKRVSSKKSRPAKKAGLQKKRVKKQPTKKRAMKTSLASARA
jgi:hypothetical protein